MWVLLLELCKEVLCFPVTHQSHGVQSGIQVFRIRAFRKSLDEDDIARGVRYCGKLETVVHTLTCVVQSVSADCDLRMFGEELVCGESMSCVMGVRYTQAIAGQSQNELVCSITRLCKAGF